jgi:DNA (cytosine-5)-methyltransferase 1
MYKNGVEMLNYKMKGLSLFSSAGVAELRLNKYINFVLANELLAIRGKVHEFWHPNAEMICGDITNESIKDKIISNSISKGVDFILATPPCQGVSLIGKNKRNDQFINDNRNFLIFHALDIVDIIKPNIVVIENVDRFAKMFFPYNGGMHSILEILKLKYDGVYNIDCTIYNSADYGVPQARKRLIIVLFKNGYEFITPKKVEKHVTVREAIGNLPSLESGETSNIKHHNSRIHTQDHISFMQHTPTGKSAFQNEHFFPMKKDGTRIIGYPYTYKRIDWDRPAPTITMRSDAISATHTVHPGRLLSNGLYSDARVLSLRELFILSSMNPDIDLPDFASDSQIRHIIGEAVPPLLMEQICKNIKKIKE